ncbi:AAA family ATPase [Enhygromyxa salina]|uniref:histidine kinase n=1 Tax=Enhygromyxa salina TaxID=215803 RepID=A0A2S9Y2I9_9BACT|nr:ATP-binding protein [Enhygromyxa salina]PRP99309.1 Sporulation kinase E [Enhygromyxa salina]
MSHRDPATPSATPRPELAHQRVAGYSSVGVLQSSAGVQVHELERAGPAPSRVLANVYHVHDQLFAARVSHELQLLGAVEVEGFVPPLAVERVGDLLVVLRAPPPGVSLASLCASGGLSTALFCTIARGLTRILAGLHATGVLHRDIKPSSVWFDHSTGRVYLTDAGVAALLERERSDLADPDLIQARYGCVAPEQLSQVVRVVDARSDLYSVGAIFYQLLTGALPFPAVTVAALIDAQLGSAPRPLYGRVVGLPRVLAELVARLLEKTPARRYQTASGLLADLQRVVDAREHGDGDPWFEVGASERATGLMPATKLHGREFNARTMAIELGRARERRDRRLMVVHGEGGIGKSALLEAFESVVAGAAGTFAFGRYHAPDPSDGLGGLSGLSGLIEALTGVSKRLSLAPEHERASWREHLVAQVGPLLPLVTALVPGFESIVGRPPTGPLADGSARDAGRAGHALELALSRLFVALERIGTPVLVLDDLQWADARSIELLRALLLDHVQSPLLIVVACTSAALEPAAPLGQLLTELAQLGREPGVVALERLGREAFQQLLGELLGGEFADLVNRDSFLSLVAEQTANHPAAVKSYLVELAERGLLHRTPEGWAWTDDSPAPGSAEVPRSTNHLLAGEPAGGPAGAGAWDERERELLARAACLSRRFDPGALAELCELSPAALAAELHELERRRVLVCAGGELQFCDPQLRAAAHEWLAPRPRARVHATIAEGLLARHGLGSQLGTHAFALVHHRLSTVPELEGAEAFAGLAEARRLEVLEGCAVAGAHAVMLGARDVASAYLEFATALADAVPRSKVALGVELALSRAVVLAWSQRDADADAAFEQLLARPLPAALVRDVVIAAIRSLVARGRSDDALELGLAGLARCGVEPSVTDLGAAASRVRAAWTAQPDWLDALHHGPELLVAELDAAMSILAALARALLGRDARSFACLACAHVELLVIHGFHRTAPAALAGLGLVLATRLGEADHGARLCDAANELCARAPAELEQGLWVESIAWLRVWPLSRPLDRSHARPRQLLREAVDHGALELAASIANAEVARSLAGAGELGGVSELIARGQRWSARLDGGRDAGGALDLRLAFAGHRRVVERLQRPLEAGVSGGWLGEAELERGSAATRAGVWIFQSVAQWLLGERAAATASVSRFVGELEHALAGSWTGALAVVMSAITASAQLSVGESIEPQARAQLDHARALAGGFAAQGWTNFSACAELVAAEHARGRGRIDQAFASYERACDLAETTDRSCVHALACERLLSLAQAHGRQATARGATLTAITRARRWGASELVAQLERGHPEHAELVAQASSLPTLGPPPVAASAIAPGDAREPVDSELLVGMLYLIGEDLDLDEVVSRVLEGALATSDAERGVLLLERDGELYEVARACQGARLIRVDDAVALAHAGDQLPVTAIDHAMRTGTALVLDDATTDPRFASDPYVQLTRPRSLLCTPISGPVGQIGALMLEHLQVVGVFSGDRLSALRVLASQAGATLGHARIHEALQRSQALFQTVVSGAPDMIALLDRHGRIEFINHLGGFPGDPASLIGMDAALLLGANAAPRWRAAVANVRETGEQQEFEIELELPDGTVHWYEIRVGAVGFGSRHGNLLSVSTNITGRKRAEAERLSLEAQLRQQQRLDSVGTLASGVAHEINNPIQGIMNYAELIAGRADDPALVGEFAQEILVESDRVATIVRNLLAFSRQDVDEPPELRRVEDLVATTLTLFRAVVTRDGIILRVDTPTGLPRVRCRPQQVQQVIMNLVTNARDAVRSMYPDPKRAPEGSNVIAISACAVEADQGPLVRLSVTDRGGGVPDHVRARIFDPFFTTKGRDQGTGLGLAVSHGIAGDHGGELWFETEPGVGSVFHLDLPGESA